MIDGKNLLVLADKSLSNHHEFSKFVNFAESLKDANVSKSFFDTTQQKVFDSIWFELEIINALALDEWECAGKPPNWQCEWDAKFKEECSQVIASFKKLISIGDARGV